MGYRKKIIGSIILQPPAVNFRCISLPPPRWGLRTTETPTIHQIGKTNRFSAPLLSNYCCCYWWQLRFVVVVALLSTCYWKWFLLWWRQTFTRLGKPTGFQHPFSQEIIVFVNAVVVVIGGIWWFVINFLLYNKLGKPTGFQHLFSQEIIFLVVIVAGVHDVLVDLGGKLLLLVIFVWLFCCLLACY